jgi:hypothetical protein
VRELLRIRGREKSVRWGCKMRWLGSVWKLLLLLTLLGALASLGMAVGSKFNATWTGRTGNWLSRSSRREEPHDQPHRAAFHRARPRTRKAAGQEKIVGTMAVGFEDLLQPLTAGSGPSRHFAATQQFSRFRSEADIQRGVLLSLFFLMTIAPCCNVTRSPGCALTAIS